ncbi:MAG: 30S ribosome-binding factor RbfA [Dongiaceae bacterium]
MIARQPESGPSQRQLRVGEEVRHALVRIFSDAHWRDPALFDVNITLTEVRLGPDLKRATAFVLPFAGGDASELVAALNRAVPYLRRELGRAMRLRHVPDLEFERDRSFDEAARIAERLEDPVVRRDLERDDDADNTGNDGGDDTAGSGSDGAPT